MKCPNCNSKNVYVTHSYSAGTEGSTQRRECRDCDMIFTTATVILTMNPRRGEGASAVADRMRKEGSLFRETAP